MTCTPPDSPPAPARWASILALALAAVACGREEPEAPPPRPRPVAVVTLDTIDPIGPLQLTGAVHSWKEADVAFEVAGPVAFVVEPGDNFTGRWVADDEVLVEGDVLARLDPRLFEIRKATAEAGVLVARENLRLAQVQLADVLPAQVQGAEADKVRAEAEYTRVKAAFEREAMSEIDYIRAEADKDGTAARYVEALAELEAKKAEIQALEAQVEEALAQRNEAQYDLDRCVLRAPFDAQVSEVYVEAGGYARASEPLAHLIMMDPVQVDISVSQETAARLREGDRVKLSLPGADQPLAGRVHEKATVADLETRTFRISILVRNVRRTGTLRVDDPLLALPRVRSLGPLLHKELADMFTTGPTMVDENLQLRFDEVGAYVWVAEGMVFGDVLDPAHPVVRVRKARVVPGDLRVNYQGIYVLRELADLGDLSQDSMLCWDVPEGLSEGDEVLVGEEEWHLLPGQLVRVFLGTDPPAPGFYLPMTAIRARESGRHSVFVVVDGAVKQVPVRLGEPVGALFRVEPDGVVGTEQLVEGAQVVVRHVHFLVDGEAVRVTDFKELVP